MKRGQTARNKTTLLALLSALTLSVGISGCLNNGRTPFGTTLSDGSSSTTSTISAQGDVFAIANVTIAAASGAQASQTPVTTIYIDPSKSVAASGTAAPLMNTYCAGPGTNGATNSKACVCQFTWTEINSTTGTNVNVKRTVETTVTNAQQALVTCAAPDVYSTEVADGTSLKITVLAGPSNSSVFTVTPYTYTKNSGAATGSFRDAEGRAFDNVMHYACYEQFKKGTQIQSKIGTANNSSTGESVQYPYANQFCVQKSGSAAGQGCPNMSSQLFNSAQANYYNLYIRATEAGDANQWNDRYTCPKIKESLNNPSGSTAGQGALWPLDTNFALSMGRTTDFNVGVDAFVELANGGSDPVSASAKTCAGAVSASNSSTTGFVQGCLGFATKPNQDGTCPYFRDSNGQIRFTYRLRRFIALYPPVFDVDGKPADQSQPTDTVYVLDRPVTPPSGNDILKPFTMRGPKPCPFAYYDSKGVTGKTDPSYSNYSNVLPTYVSTNNPAWNGTNVDGIEFPNIDSGGANGSTMSCSAAFPLVKTDAYNPDLGVISMATLHSTNPVLKRLFVRPTRAWAPHYEEDTSFQACAPQASPHRDPPLHFSKDPTTGNVAWCSESYPSQNDHIPVLDRLADPSQPLSTSNKYLGKVRPFTSHVSKHTASASCSSTIPASIPGPSSGTSMLYPSATTTGCPTYPAASTPAGLARHPNDAVVDTVNDFSAYGVALNTGAPSSSYACSNQTCDRTAINAGGLNWQSFPLLASPNYVEEAIASDTTYGCIVTWDNNGNKVGKASPTEGCCGANVKLYTGAIPLSGTYPRERWNRSAHLETDAACLIPKY